MAEARIKNSVKMYLLAFVITLVISLVIRQYGLNSEPEGAELESLDTKAVYSSVADLCSGVDYLKAESNDYWAWFLGGTWVSIAIFFVLSMVFGNKKRK